MITPQGNLVIGKKGRSGRKSKRVEIQGAIENITNDALIKLARSKVFKQLNQDLDFNQTKEMGLPVALKGITDKKDITSGGLKISFDDIFKITSKTKGSGDEPSEVQSD